MSILIEGMEMPTRCAEINGLLNTEKTVKWCRARQQKRINDAFKEEAK